MLKMLSLLMLLLLLPGLATTAPLTQSTPQVVYLWPSGAATLQGAGEKEITDPPNPPPQWNPIRDMAHSVSGMAHRSRCAQAETLNGPSSACSQI